jgi:hypothetical protein
MDVVVVGGGRADKAEVVAVMVGKKEIVCTCDVRYLVLISHQKYTAILRK